jgi:hypothetical protein
MTRIDLIHAIAERHGLSIVEFFAIEMVTVFATDRSTTARFVAKIVEESPYADADCEAAVESCLQKSWLAVSPYGMLALTSQGYALRLRITGELRDRGL